MKILNTLQSISAHRDEASSYTEYVNIATTEMNLQMKAQDGETIQLPKGSTVTYTIREYNGNIGLNFLTILAIYYNNGYKVFSCTDSTCTNINAATHYWGMEDYRDHFE